MMNYEIFKEVVKEKFMDYMPEKFKGNATAFRTSITRQQRRMSRLAYLKDTASS